MSRIVLCKMSKNMPWPVPLNCYSELSQTSWGTVHYYLQGKEEMMGLTRGQGHLENKSKQDGNKLTVVFINYTVICRVKWPNGRHNLWHFYGNPRNKWKSTIFVINLLLFVDANNYHMEILEYAKRWSGWSATKPISVRHD